MSILGVIHYINIAFLGIACTLAAVKYARSRSSIYLTIGTGAAVYLSSRLIAVIYIGGDTIQGFLWPPALEIAALFLWMLVLLHDDAGRKVQTAVWSGIFILFAVCFLIIMILITRSDTVVHALLFPAAGFCIVAYCLFYAAANNRHGMHYIFQTFLFLGTALAATAIEPVATAHSLQFRLAAEIARAFAFISMIVFMETAIRPKTETETYETGLGESVLNTASEINRRLQEIPENMDRNEIFKRGLELISGALRDNLDFDHIYLAGKTDVSEPIFEDCLARTPGSAVTATLRIPSSLINELRAEKKPILISDVKKHKRLHAAAFERLGIRSFFLIPITAGSNLDGIFLLGAGAERSRRLLDMAAIDYLVTNISILFSYIRLRCEMSTVPEVDAITLLRNFSSFHRLLSNAIDEADKNGSTLALIFFDVDHFSSVNEKLGFEKGDQLLRELGAALAEYAEPGKIGRIGADEFAIIIPCAREDIRENLEVLLTEINTRTTRLCADVPITISAAFSIYPFDFFEKSGVFSKMREMLGAGRTASSQLVRVKVG